MVESSIRRALLIGHAKKGGTAELINRHAEWLGARGVETVQITDRDA